MFKRISVSALLLIALASASVAHADSATEKAQAGLAELRFEDARTIATDGLEEGTRGPEELSPLYMILGQVSASLGEDKEAEAHFRAAISLDANASLPEGVSPKLSEPFSAAVSSLKNEQAIDLLSELDADGQLSVQVASDPAELVGGVEATFQLDGESKSERAEGTGTLRLELPSGVANVQVALIDKHGNRLTAFTKVDSSEAVEADIISTKPPGSKAAGPPIYKRWQLYAGLAVGSLATGAYFGNVSRSKTDEIAQLEDGTEFSVAQDLEDQAKKNALFANIGFAATVGLGAAAVWMYMSEEPTAEADSATAFVPMLGTDRIGVAAHVSF